VTRGYRHFLYGGKEGVAEELKAELLKRFPGLQIVGTYTPPFRPLNSAEEKALHKQLEALQVDVFWCGLSTPKQERFMAKYHKVLPVKLMVGVGAAFDLLSGNLEESPDWMKNAGLQWLFRLVKEPKRLWRRYLFNNPRFLWYTFLQLTHLKSYQLAAKGSAQSCRPVHPSTRIGSRAGAFVMPSPQERTFVPMHVRTSTSTASITAMSEMARTRYSHSDSRVNHP
jgi:exopolysaccharide biosynthesis WecB/TagA/CpsF family protein